MDVGGVPGQSRDVVLDYLRGIAALMVLIVHWGTTGIDPPVEAARLYMSVSPPATHENFIGIAMDYWALVARPTWIFDIRLASGGVMLFFLVSGYVIPISVERYTTSAFAIRRAFRLLPPLWAALLIWVVLNAAFQAWGYAAENPISLRALLANMLLVHDWLWIPHIDLAFWTLVVEMKFYVVMAAMIVAARRVTIPSIFAAAFFFVAISSPFFGTAPGAAYDRLYSMMGETGYWWVFFAYRILNDAAPYIVFMLCGTVIYLWRRDRITGGAALVFVPVLFALFATIFMVSPNGSGQIYYVEDALRALILFWAALAVDRAGWLAGKAPWLTKPLAFFGSISYPLYVTHGLVGMSIILATYTATGNMTFGLLVGVVTVFPLSWAIHRFIEMPGQKAGGKVARGLAPRNNLSSSQSADA